MGNTKKGNMQNSKTVSPTANIKKISSEELQRREAIKQKRLENKQRREINAQRGGMNHDLGLEGEKQFDAYLKKRGYSPILMPVNHSLYDMKLTDDKFNHYIQIKTNLGNGKFTQMTKEDKELLIKRAQRYGKRPVLVNVPLNNVNKYTATYLDDGSVFRY